MSNTDGKQVIDYKVIQSEDARRFEGMVSKALEAGYMLHSNTFIHRSDDGAGVLFSVVVVKYDNDKTVVMQ